MARSHLFNVNPEVTKLDEKQSILFHNFVAKLLFLCKWAWPDLQTAAAFLSIRVRALDSDDYKNCAGLYNTYILPRRYIRAELTHDVKWRVDVSHAVHPDMRSHTSGVMTLGKGAIFGTFTRQKLHAKSSTESERISADDVMPQLLWTQYYLEAQGYEVRDSVMDQDNQSGILLEKNGNGSSSRQTWHMNIRHFFVTHHMKKGDVSITYCQTGDLLADVFT